MKIPIEQIWKTEQEILDMFHDVCVKNELRYSLEYGTLIEAVRHKGFIPWDDGNIWDYRSRLRDINGNDS